MGVFIRLLGYVSKNWPYFLTAVACIASSTIAMIQIPILTKDAIGLIDLFGKGQLPAEHGMNRLLFLVLGIVGLTTIVGFFSFVQRYANVYFSQKVIYDIRNDVFASLQSQSFAFYDRARTGQLLTKVTTDVERIRMFLEIQFSFLISSMFLLVGVLYQMFFMDIRLTLSLILLLPFLLLASFLFGKKIRPLFTEMREQYGSLTSVLGENITGIRVVRAFAREEFERKKFASINEGYFQTTIASVRIRAFYIPLTTFIIGLSLTIIFGYGGSQAIAGTLRVEHLVAFMLYLEMLVMPLRFLGLFTSGYHLSMAAGKRVLGIIDAEPEIKEKAYALKIPKIRGHVKFENVSFGYEEDRQTLKNISFEAKPGQTVALLGATGSGKSTIIRLIPRFYDVSAGKITVDGYDLRDIKLESLRKQIGIVSQESFLFNMSVKENIAYGNPGTTIGEIVAAAKAAKAHAFISALPHGYNTCVGERGATLSGGQQQRIAIARALLSDPKIIILDDSTSSVDVETEFEIQQALQALLKNRTTFIITQRVSTIRNADKIIILKDGEIAEVGSHKTLLAKKGTYYKIYQTLYEAQKPIIEAKPNRASKTDTSLEGEEHKQ